MAPPSPHAHIEKNNNKQSDTYDPIKEEEEVITLPIETPPTTQPPPPNPDSPDPEHTDPEEIAYHPLAPHLFAPLTPQLREQLSRVVSQYKQFLMQRVLQCGIIQHRDDNGDGGGGANRMVYDWDSQMFHDALWHWYSICDARVNLCQSVSPGFAYLEWYNLRGEARRALFRVAPEVYDQLEMGCFPAIWL